MPQVFDRSSNALARASLVLTGLIVIALGVTAADLATRMRHRPEIALTHLGMAELLLDGPHPNPLPKGEAELNSATTDDIGSVGARHASPWTPSAAERADALHHLDFAIAELQAMRMQPALERALRHKEVLKA